MQSQSALQQSQTALSSANSSLAAKQIDVNDLASQRENLSLRLSAAMREADETAVANEELQTRIKELEKEQNATVGREVLGRKPLNELGRTQVTTTKKAYKDKFQEPINRFGTNRGLVLETMTLRDADGERLVVNAEPQRKYEELLPAQKKRVVQTSRWKDLNRVPDRVYSSIANNNSLPAASHVKEYEKELNAQLPEIKQVSFG